MFLRGSRLRLEGVGVGGGCVGMGVGWCGVWGVGAPIETPFNNFNSPVSVRGGQAEEQGPQALEGKVETYDPCFLEVFGPQIRSILRHN